LQDCFDEIAKFQAVLAEHGLPGALAFLNRRGPHRYTAVYRLDGDTMVNIGIHDRLGLVASPLPPIARDHSLCQYVTAEQAFVTENVLEDPRLSTHFQRGLINAYVGLPLSRGPSHLYGTLCQMDPDAQALSASEYRFFELVAPLLVDYLD
jgi:GAF domain-containing protein